MYFPSLFIVMVEWCSVNEYGKEIQRNFVYKVTQAGNGRGTPVFVLFPALLI